MPGEKVHLHHIDGNHSNWKRSNLLAIHESCHDYIHIGTRDDINYDDNPFWYLGAGCTETGTSGFEEEVLRVIPHIDLTSNEPWKLKIWGSATVLLVQVKSLSIKYRETQNFSILKVGQGMPKPILKRVKRLGREPSLD